MYLFNEDLHLTKYNSTVEIMNEFFLVRIRYYIKRREHVIKNLEHELQILESKSRFIREYIDNTLEINKKSKEFIISLLNQRNYMLVEENYDYLLKLPVYSFTLEKIQDLEKECEKKKQDLELIRNLNEKDLWKQDLEELLKVYINTNTTTLPSKKRGTDQVLLSTNKRKK